jgi:hypothetical protein
MGVRFTLIDVDGFPGYTLALCAVHPGDDCCDQLHGCGDRALPAALGRRRAVVDDRVARVEQLRGRRNAKGPG